MQPIDVVKSPPLEAMLRRLRLGQSLKNHRPASTEFRSCSIHGSDPMIRPRFCYSTVAAAPDSLLLRCIYAFEEALVRASGIPKSRPSRHCTAD